MTAQASDPDAMITETSDAEAPKKGVVDYTALETSLNDLKLLAKVSSLGGSYVDIPESTLTYLRVNFARMPLRESLNLLRLSVYMWRK